MPAFDGYRAWAILGVVLFHIFEVTGVFAAMGDSWAGILDWGLLPRSLDALFIVSGFVIYLPTVVRDGDFGRVSSFAVRRAARLFPAYYVVLAIALLLLATVPSSQGVPDAGTIGAHLAVLQTPALLVADHFRLGFGVVAPVWTLSVEIGFYIVLPLVAVRYFRHPLAGLLIAAAIVAAWKLVAEHPADVTDVFGVSLSQDVAQRIASFYSSQFPSWVLALAAGMTGAWVYVRLRDRVPPERLARAALWGAALGAVALALVIYFAGHEAVEDPAPFEGLFAGESLLLAFCYPLAMAALFVGITLIPTRLQQPFTARPIRWIGDVSYAIYLIHFAVIWFMLQEISLPQEGVLLSALLWSAIVYPISIAWAYLSARLIERPVRRWAQRYGRRAEKPRELEPAVVDH